MFYSILVLDLRAGLSKTESEYHPRRITTDLSSFGKVGLQVEIELLSTCIEILVFDVQVIED